MFYMVGIFFSAVIIFSAKLCLSYFSTKKSNKSVWCVAVGFFFLGAVIIFCANFYLCYFSAKKSNKSRCSLSATGSAPPRFSRSADSRRGYFVALRDVLFTLHKLLPLISDVELNRLLSTGQADLILFSKSAAVLTRLACSALCSLFH